MTAEDVANRQVGQGRYRLAQIVGGASIGYRHLRALHHQIACHAETATTGAESEQRDPFSPEIGRSNAGLRLDHNCTSAMATPTSPAIIARIQKRIVTCVSDQPSISK